MQPLSYARCCYDNTASLCDVYKFNIKNLIDLPKHCVTELFWKVFVHSGIGFGLRQGVFTFVTWQITLCDPTWQVTLRSYDMEFH